MMTTNGGDDRPAVALVGVSHAYGSAIALDNVTLSVAAGEFLTLLGPSGSGKTTTLSLLSGFLTPTSGRVLIGGEDVTSVPAHRRNVGVVFQNYALFPHMTVLQNVCFPLKVRHVGRREAAERARNALKLVQMEELAGRFPKQLSGGQQQRVALARAMVYEPPVLLMDEPFGALDRRLRQDMQLSLRVLHQRLGITIIFVTHDQEEALTMSDRVALMHNGRIEQTDTPRTLYEAPRSQFAAEFMGRSNILACEVIKVTASGLDCVTSSGAVVRAGAGGSEVPGQLIKLVLRPERIRILSGDDDAGYDNVLGGEVDDAVFLGDGSNYLVRLDDGGQLLTKDVNRGRRPSGRVRVAWHASDAVIIDGLVKTGTTERLGTQVG